MKRPDCIACNGGLWSGKNPPRCICNDAVAINLDTLSLCRHGVPIKFGCMTCDIENKNSSKEEFITIPKYLWDKMIKNENELLKRIEKLESYPLENGSIVFTTIVERITKLEQLLEDFIRSANGRIENLTNHKNYQIDENRKVAKRLEELSDSYFCLFHETKWIFERIEKLENKINY